MLREYHRYIHVCMFFLSIVADDNAAVYKVFRAHFDQLVMGITSLATMVSILYSKGLISDVVKRNLTTLTGFGDVEKASKLLDEVETTMRSAPRASRVLLDLCSALDNEPALKRVVDSIRSELGIHTAACMHAFIIHNHD